MNKIELKDVSFAYHPGTPFQTRALDRVTVGFEADAITGLIGHTGCGKSTLVQLLNGLLSPTEGQVLLDGKSVNDKGTDKRDLRFRVGLVFQYPEYQLFEETVYEDIAFGPKNMGLTKEEIDRRVKEAAEFVGIGESYFQSSPFDLSGGQKRRVAIAGILAMDPEVLVLDEPAAGLDPGGRREILGRIRDYQRTSGSSVILVSHSMEDMARYADRIVVMDHGRIDLVGSCSEVFSRPDDLRSAGLDVPQITRLFLRLREKGADVPTDIFTVEQARTALLSIMEGRHV